MSSMLSRLSAADEAPVENRRRMPRALVQIEAAVASLHGQTCQMGIADVSEHGCCLSSDADWLRVGGFISIDFESGLPLEGLVRWLRDGKAGVEFLRPVPQTHRDWHELIGSFGTQ